MSDEKKKKDQEKSRKTRRNMMSVWLLAAVAISVVMTFQMFSSDDHRMSYSDFKQHVREGRIRSVSIGEKSITGELTQKADTGEPLTFTTLRIDDPDLIRELEAQRIHYSGKDSRTWLSNIVGWVIPAAILVVALILIMGRIGPGSTVMSFGKSQAKFYEEDEMKVTFDDVAGIDEAKVELMEVIEFLKTPEKFTNLGGKIPKGALLVGAPGTGKTMLAKAVAGEAQVPFLSISGSAFVEMFVGVGASRVRDLFNQAEHKAPCIIFIDELDALGKSRGINPVGGHDEREQTLNQLLVEMDGFDSRAGIIIMAATNRPEILDSALMRPGRFDRQIFVDRPDIRGREQILKVHAKEVKLSEDVDLAVIAGRTPGFVGADLANIINEAALLAARRDKQAVEMVELEESIDRVVAGLEKKSRVMNAKEKEITAYHEAGHALAATFLPDATPVHKVSIIPRGFALGVTMFLPTEDRYLLTRDELLDRIGTALGGRVAEELIFKQVTSGASSDLRQATDIARMMVTEYGMSDKLGLVTFEGARRSHFMFDGGGGDGAYSDETAFQIDGEIKAIVDSMYMKVRDILHDHEDILRRVAALLLEKEVIERDEFDRIVSGQEPDDDPADELEKMQDEIQGSPQDDEVLEIVG